MSGVMEGDPAGLPALPPAATAADLAAAEALSAQAAAYARASLAPATRRAYESHLRAWTAWCHAAGRAALPASPALVANHLAALAGVRSKMM